MFDNAALLFVLSAAISSFGGATGFSPTGPSAVVRSVTSSTIATTELGMMGVAPPAMVENETFQRSLLAAQIANRSSTKKVGGVGGGDGGKIDPNPVNIGWDTHKPVVSDILFAGGIIFSNRTPPSPDRIHSCKWRDGVHFVFPPSSHPSLYEVRPI
jgi:hypothetical protein